MGEFRMPSLGADMEAGTLVEWLVKPGDRVQRGDVIAVVETEKGAIEVEVFEAGIVETLLVESGARVPVGAVLATIASDSETPGPAAIPAPPAVPAASSPEAAPSPARPLAAASPRMRISPLARRLAEERGVDLALVQGTGPGGAITREDVEAAAAPARAAGPTLREAPSPPPPESRSAAERHAAMRHAIAVAMARSKREIPHYYLETFIDMKRSLAWLEAENLKRPVTERALYAALLLKAVALAVREVPEMNGFWVDGSFRPGDAVHVGVAISLRQGGLVAPAIHDTDKKSLGEVMRDLRDLVGRARSGSFRSSEVSDPTITVTNLGEQGVASVYGIIYPPQVALVGFGKILERPWAIDGMLAVRPILTATLAADHRASDGHRGGLFLAAIDRLLQEPEKL
jgi:pyruvate dehydrogenase E2 component (dihydrolipoamide acetyltransferase)